MAKGDPNIPMDMSKQGDDALWEEVEHYLRWKDDHTMMFEREFFRRIILFLYTKAKEKELTCLEESSRKRSWSQRLSSILPGWLRPWRS